MQPFILFLNFKLTLYNKGYYLFATKDNLILGLFFQFFDSYQDKILTLGAQRVNRDDNIHFSVEQQWKTIFGSL